MSGYGRVTLTSKSSAARCTRNRIVPPDSCLRTAACMALASKSQAICWSSTATTQSPSRKPTRATTLSPLGNRTRMPPDGVVGRVSCYTSFTVFVPCGAHKHIPSAHEGHWHTADLAEAHMRGYAAAAQEINQMISDAVVSELSLRGQECQFPLAWLS